MNHAASVTDALMDDKAKKPRYLDERTWLDDKTYSYETTVML